MKKWGVTLPITGTIYVEVQAENAKAAIDAALDEAGGKASLETLEWETHRQVCRGNVFAGALNDAFAEDLL